MRKLVKLIYCRLKLKICPKCPFGLCSFHRGVSKQPLLNKPYIKVSPHSQFFTVKFSCYDWFYGHQSKPCQTSLKLFVKIVHDIKHFSQPSAIKSFDRFLNTHKGFMELHVTVMYPEFFCSDWDINWTHKGATMVSTGQKNVQNLCLQML